MGSIIFSPHSWLKRYVSKIGQQEAGKDVNAYIDLEDSIDRAEIVLGLCEGEIEGLADGPKSFYVNDTALENSNGDNNFTDFVLDNYLGSGVEEEKLTYYLGGAARSTSVGVTLSGFVPIVRQTQTGNLNFIEVRVIVQALLASGKKGPKSNTVNLKIEYKKVSDSEWINILGSYNFGGEQTPDHYVIKGCRTGNTALEFRIEVEPIDEPYEIRVTKLSEDVTSASESNTLIWESFQEGFTTPTSYPNTALAHVYMQYSDQLTSVPSFYGIYKLAKIRVPSNYNPETRVYDGDWDGTFKRAWSDNPAWCLYDFIMNDRYGVNAYSSVALDKWDCYEAGQWCDELVSDGKGGTQPRYTCNLVQTEATNGREFAVYLASLFNGVLVEPSTGYLRLFVEKDADAVYLFTPENVTEQGFSYSFTSPETRYNDIKVSFTNPNLNWEADTRRVYNQEDIDKNGRVTYDFAAVGCIREGEAMRRAYYKMITSITETTTVTFTTNRQAQGLSNFDIILIADPVLGYSLPGRIKDLSVDRKTVYLRDSIYLEAGIPYKMQINLPEGLYETEINPLSGSGSMKEFTVRDALPENLPEAAAFTISGSDRSGTPKPFRIMSITEVEGNPDNYTISALELNRNKWDAADNMEMADMPEYSGLPSANDIPHLIDASFLLSYNPVDLQTELLITPTYDESYPYYSGRLLVYSRSIYESAWTQREIKGNNIVVDHPAGEYEFRILPISTTGITPTFETAPIFTYTVEDVTNRPANIKNLQVTRSANGIQLSWDPVDNLDLLGYEVREGTDWESGTVITTDFSGTSTYILINDAQTHHYMVCAKNYLGLYSSTPAFISSSVSVPEDVSSFYATVSLDRIRFDWAQVPGNDLEYEIRQGDNWATALVVARIKGNNTTILLPSLPTITYGIKARSPAGLYSANPRYTQPDMKLKPDRNVIVRIDNGAQGFPGITHGFEPITREGEIIPNAMVMMQEFSRAEHYFPVELRKETRARNWFETTAFANLTRMTWLDMHYMYTQAEAHVSWIGSTELDADGSIEPVIMRYLGGENYDKYIGFPYTENLKDLRELVSPTATSGTINYVDAHITKGLELHNDVKLSYESGISIPEVFHFTFRLKVDDTAYDNNLNLITLIGPNRNYIKIYVHNNKVYCRCSDHKDLVIDYRRATKLDFLTFGFSQSATERALYFFADYANFISNETIEAAPLGSFTKYYLNRKIGDTL